MNGAARHPTGPSGDGSVIGYLRVSTAEQAHSGLGLAAQQSAIVAGAARLGLPIASMHVDAGVSGGLSLEQRPGLLSALDALGKGDVLLVAKRDRLGRDVLNVCLIQKLVDRKGARVVSAAGEGSDDDGPTSVLMRQIIDAFSQYERALIRARTSAAMRVKKVKGERAGNVAFGFQVGADGRTLTEDVTEQRTLLVLRHLHGSGKSLRAIAAELNRLGLRTRCGGDWRHQYVHDHVLAASASGAAA